MSFYARISPHPADTIEVQAAKERTASNLLRLRAALDESIPAKRIDGKLLLATWNVREFGEGRFRAWGGPSTPASSPVASPYTSTASTETVFTGPSGSPTRPWPRGRTPDAAAAEEHGMKGRYWESIYYIAEIINRFDLVALQEVRDDMEDFQLVVQILGRWWKYLVTDVAAGSQGNRERVAFLYDERKLKFDGLAGEVVLPPVRKQAPAFQLARTPFIVGFCSGWFRFTICSTHLYYGQSRADDPQRLREMDLLAGTLAGEVKKPTAWAKNMILLGDFNIFSTEDQQYKVLTQKHGFTVPRTMIGKRTNAGQNHPYDQIAFIAPSLGGRLEHSQSGIFPIFDHVFRDEDEALYAALMGSGYDMDSKGRVRNAAGKRGYYRDKWRTFQMSDHNPLWVELESDFSDDYLKRLGARKPA